MKTMMNQTSTRRRKTAVTHDQSAIATTGAVVLGIAAAGQNDASSGATFGEIGTVTSGD